MSSKWDRMTGKYAYQREDGDRMASWLSNGNKGFLNFSQMGAGKAEFLDALLLTPRGWTRMGDIRVGDRVVGKNGRPTTVLGVYPQGVKDVFSVHFRDGAVVECSDDHLWKVRGPGGLDRGVLPLNDIRSRLRDAAGNCRYFIPMVGLVEFDDIWGQGGRPLDPYLLGVLIGNGGLGEDSIRVSGENDLIEGIRDHLPSDVMVGKKPGDNVDYTLYTEPRFAPNPVLNSIRALGLAGHCSPEKFIPDAYKMGPVRVRLDTLRGILDCDTHVRESDVEYSSASRRLIEDVQFIVWSLGGKGRITEKPVKLHGWGESRIYYRLHVALPGDITPFRLGRKLRAYQPRTKYQPSRAIVKVERTGERKECQCIKVDAPDGLYVTNDFVVTHNTPESLYVAEKLRFQRILVTCSVTLKYEWARQLEDWCGVKAVIGKEDSKRRLDPLFEHSGGVVGLVGNDPLYFVINYASFRLEHIQDILKRYPFDMLIIDEAHRIRNRKAQQTKGIFEFVKGQPHMKRLLLTGSPIVNSPADLYPLLVLARPEEYDWAGWRRFLNTYCLYNMGPFGMIIYGEMNLDALQRRTEQFTLRRERPADLGKYRRPVPLEMGRDQRKIYDTLKDELAVQWRSTDGGRDKVLFATQVLPRLIRLRQIALDPRILGMDAKGAKTDFIQEVVGDYCGKDGKKLVIYSCSKVYIYLLQGLIEKMGIKTVAVTGDVKETDRPWLVKRFQEGDAMVFLGVISGEPVATEGLSLTAASDMVVADKWWTNAVMEQAEDRLPRPGQKDTVQIIQPRNLNSVDEIVDAILERKARMGEHFLGKRLEVEVMEELIGR